jgi:hypothetical protein
LSCSRLVGIFPGVEQGLRGLPESILNVVPRFWVPEEDILRRA